MRAITGVPHAGRFIDVLLSGYVHKLITEQYHGKPEIISELIEYILTAEGQHHLELAKIRIGNSKAKEVKKSVFNCIFTHSFSV